MRQRLDLDTMLRKYEGNYSSNQLRKESPYRIIHAAPQNKKQNIYVIPQMQNKLKIQKFRTQSNYYPQNNYEYYQTVSNRMQMPVESQRNQTREKVNSVTFQMSKSECQKLLRGIREEVRLQQREIEGHILRGINELQQKFQIQHDELRRQLINLVDHCLQINKRQALQVLQGYRKQYPSQYVTSKKKMQAIDEQINRLLNGLNGIQFKKVIAEIVTKDFSEMLKIIRQDTKYANKAYKDNLHGIQMDKNVIIKIKESLKHIYYWKGAVNQHKYTEDNQRLMKTSRSSSKKKIFEPRNGNNRLIMTQHNEVRQKSEPKAMRRSFFNFDNKYE